MNSEPVLPPLSIASQIDAVCDQFEAEWKAGRPGRIEDILGPITGQERAEFLRALLGVELELRSSQDEVVDRGSYLSRFSDLTSVVEEVFHDWDSRRRAGDTSRSEQAVQTARSDAPTLQDASPRLIGRFEVVALLGEGAFGSVYRARDPQLEREVAVKVPKLVALGEGFDLNRFFREARAAATIRHPNVCPVYEVGNHEGRPYIVMAYVPGESLADHLGKRKSLLPDRQAAMIVRKLASALQAAHAKGIVHRDLKPANILIDQDRKDVLVTDFGLAREERPDRGVQTRSGTLVGTPAYMAPEQARGDVKAVGPHSDIYALGVILYEMLAGRRPFRGTAGEVIGAIQHVQPEPPSKHRPGVDPQLEAICLKAMSKDIASRYASMADLASALNQFLRTEKAGPSPLVCGTLTALTEVPVSQPKPIQLPSRPPRRFGPSIVLTAAAILGLFLLAAVVVIRFKDGKGEGTVTIECDDPDVEVRVTGEKDVHILDKKSKEEIKVKAGTYMVELTRGKDKLTLETKQFTLKRGDKEIVRVYHEPKTPPATPAAESRPAADPDRRAAERLGQFGDLMVRVNGQDQKIAKGKRLPAGDFRVTWIIVEVNDQVEDADLEVLAGLPELRILKLLDCRKITDAGVARLSGLTGLTCLVLQNTQLTSEGLEHLRGMSALQQLMIGGTKVGDTGLAHLRGLTEMTELDVGRTRVTDAGLIHLRGLIKLQKLYLYDNPIGDAGLALLKELKDLQDVNLNNTRITDEGLDHLRGLSKLKTLILTTTNVTEGGVKMLHEVLPMCKIISDHGNF